MTGKEWQKRKSLARAAARAAQETKADTHWYVAAGRDMVGWIKWWYNKIFS